jgi:UDP-glucose 4-epimerase
VIAAVERATGRKIKVLAGPRRPGDPAALYADASKAQRELSWSVEYPDIDSIVATAWKWHSEHPRGYADR